MHIEQLKNSSADIVLQLNHLLTQLDKTAKPLSIEDVYEMVESLTNSLFVARDGISKNIIGMITLIVYRIPFTKKGILEDLVVDQVYRGKGIGATLMNHAIHKAREAGVSYLDFTSRPQREAANKLYERLGFQKRDTNVYRIKF